MTDSQFAANRANAANSTGPRTTNGKARSSQNARKHGFAAAAYTVPRLEDLDEVAFLREGAIKLYQPANAQELFAVERITITEHAMNRAARLEAGTFTICLNDVLNLRERPLMEMDPEMYGGGEPGKEQVKNYLLAEGFRRSVTPTPCTYASAIPPNPSVSTAAPSRISTASVGRAGVPTISVGPPAFPVLFQIPP